MCNHDQFSHIRRMEEHLNSASGALKQLSDALDAYTSIRPQLEELIHYYESPRWLADYDADNSGLLPSDLKRGVLSQDAVYDLLADHARLLDTMKEIINHERDL